MIIVFYYNSFNLQQPYLIAAIREIAERRGLGEGDTHTVVAQYLEACNLIFENGILSHDIISSSQSACLANICKGMSWFFKWKEEVAAQNAGVV